MKQTFSISEPDRLRYAAIVWAAVSEAKVVATTSARGAAPGGRRHKPQDTGPSAEDGA
jgi:hypothetical protein